MMRYVIIVALLLCLPVRGEAWQVVAGGGGGGESLGPELVKNSMFDSNSTANWTGTNATLSSTNNELIVNSTSYGSAVGAISGGLTQGVRYKLTVNIVSKSGGTVTCGVDVGGTPIISGTSQTGVFTAYVSSFFNTWEGVRVNVKGASVGVCTVDNVSLKKVL